MTDPVLFALAVLFVLATPGPTNTLLATAAATAKFKNCSALILAEAMGYTISVGILLLLVRPITDTFAAIAVVLRIISTCYLIYLAWTLWRSGEPSSKGPVRFRYVFVTTLLNPKAVVFAFLIFPGPSSPEWLLVRSAALFIAIILICSTGWLTVGAVIRQHAGSLVVARSIGKGAAVVLGCFAAIMLGSILL
jgi:threonine/homoserine/homoserine lactone efflux protein